MSRKTKKIEELVQGMYHTAKKVENHQGLNDEEIKLINEFGNFNGLLYLVIC